MPNDPTKKSSQDNSGPNPNVNSENGGINPSAPTTGTEGWGYTRDEKRALSNNHPAATRAGQMKGNPGDHMAAASERASASATTNKPRNDSRGEEQLSGK